MSENSPEAHFEHPIYALATPYATSALAIIRVCGTDCIDMLSKLCKNPERLLKSPANQSIPYQLIDRKTTDGKETTPALDTAMITPYYAPHSYTGQEAADICIHGSLAGIQRLLSALHKLGFEQADAGEFTRRAFLNGKLDLTQSEAIQDVIQANDASSHIEALEKLGGSVFAYINSIKNKLLRLVAACSVTLDYPEDEIQESCEINRKDIAEAIQMVDEALKAYDFAQLKKANLRVVLAGKTNVGKSSLFNAMLKRDRAIVSDVPGTTRDFLEQEVMLKDMSITLYDTAGIRDILKQESTTDDREHSSNNFIEDEGIRRSRDLLEHANIIIYVFDVTEGWTKKDTELLELLGYAAKAIENHKNYKNHKSLAKLLIAQNKIDLIQQEGSSQQSTKQEETIPVHIQKHGQVYARVISSSATEYQNITALQDALYDCIVSDVSPPQGEVPLVSSLRQKLALEESKEALQQVMQGLENEVPLDMISLDLDIAMKTLGTITGEVTSQDILDTVFSNFCVGK